MSEAHKQVALEFLAAMDVGDGERMGRCLTDDAFTNTQGFAGVSGRRSREMMVATASAFREIVPTGRASRLRGEGEARPGRPSLGGGLLGRRGPDRAG